MTRSAPGAIDGSEVIEVVSTVSHVEETAGAQTLYLQAFPGAKVVKAIPGLFVGDTSTTKFFLMHHLRNVENHWWKRKTMRWLSLLERSII